MTIERQREYETIFIFAPNSDDESRKKTRERVEGIISNTGGHMLRYDNWGEKRLAYRIRDREGNRHNRGVYQYYRYLVVGDTVAEIERNLRIFDNVLKYITVKLDDDVIPEVRLAAPEEEEVEYDPSTAKTGEFADDEEE